MSATTRIILTFTAFCGILITSTKAFQCYVGSASDANFPQAGQYTIHNNCTACVRGKYAYTDGNSRSIWIWGCMTGSTGMVAQSSYPGAWGTWNAGAGTWGPGVPVVAAPWTGGNPWSTWSNWQNYGAPAWAAGTFGQWAGANQWTGYPWASWGAAYAAPAGPFLNSYTNMCIEGSFEGYSSSLSANAYMCVCCTDGCNQNARCKTFNGASTLVAASSSLAMLLALTFSAVNVLNA